MMSGHKNPQPAGSSGTNQNPFQPPSLQQRSALFPTSEARKRAADVSLEESPVAKSNASDQVGEPKMGDYVQHCTFPDCMNVVVNVGTPAVKFTLCKNRLQHESQYFRTALDSANSFKEGQDLVINLIDINPEDFLVYIQSIFPTCAADLEPVSMTKPAGVGQEVTVTALLNLFHTIDRFGSLSCFTVKQRVLKSMRILCEISPNLPWSQEEKMGFLKGFSTYNIGQDTAILQELLKLEFLIDDVTTMAEVKPTILHQIMAKSVNKLKNLEGKLKSMEGKICKLEKFIDSADTLELYCESCDATVSLYDHETIPLGTIVEDTSISHSYPCYEDCKKNFIVRKKPTPTI